MKTISSLPFSLFIAYQYLFAHLRQYNSICWLICCSVDFIMRNCWIPICLIFEQIGSQCIRIKGEYTFCRELSQHFQLIQETIQRSLMLCSRGNEILAKLLQIFRFDRCQIDTDDAVADVLMQRCRWVFLQVSIFPAQVVQARFFIPYYMPTA